MEGFTVYNDKGTNEPTVSAVYKINFYGDRLPKGSILVLFALQPFMPRAPKNDIYPPVKRHGRLIGAKYGSRFAEAGRITEFSVLGETDTLLIDSAIGSPYVYIIVSC
jgi:hypothetical protein